MSPLRNPIGEVFEELAAKLHSIGYHMTTPTSRTTGPERWSLEILRNEEPMNFYWSYISDGSPVELRGPLTRTQARSLRAHLDSMLGDDDPPLACSCVRLYGYQAHPEGNLVPSDIPCPVHGEEPTDG